MLFEELYRENYKIVYGFLLNLCKNRDLAEELTAETFFRAFNHHKSFDGKVKISTWLCQIAKNEYFRYYKKLKKQIPLNGAEDFSEDFFSEDAVIDKDTALSIHKTLHNLKEPYKEVFVLRVFANLSYKEIGIIFEKTENWARVTYYRAKINLLKMMEENHE